MSNTNVLKRLRARLRALRRPLSILVTGKGGTAKSTTSINLAVLLSQAEAYVLLADADPGNRSVERWGHERGPSELDGRLHIDTAFTGDELESVRERHLGLAADGSPAVMIVDAPGGTLAPGDQLSLVDFDIILFPIDASGMGVEAARELMDDLEDNLIEQGAKAHLLRFISRWSSTMRLDETAEALKDWGELGPPVQAFVAHQDAYRRWRGITEHAPDHRAADDVVELLFAILNVAGRPGSNDRERTFELDHGRVGE